MTTDVRPELSALIRDLAWKVNDPSNAYAIGTLQQTRMRLRGLIRRPCEGIFSSRSIHQLYAVHSGGRRELQFNIGAERLHGLVAIRHGVAFSFEPSRALPTIGPLVEKVQRFNEYIGAHPHEFSGMSMWSFVNKSRSDDGPVAPIAGSLVAKGNFIFLGRHVRPEVVEVDAILRDFDRLLPLYQYVESTTEAAPGSKPLDFSPGCPTFSERATADLDARTVNICLKHKALQPLLHAQLYLESGVDNVQVELRLEDGRSVDVAVWSTEGWSFYELKLENSAIACIRTAIGQLLEYAYYPAVERVHKMFIVSEHPLDEPAVAYLRHLRARFALPLWYRRLDAEAKTLGNAS